MKRKLPLYITLAVSALVFASLPKASAATDTLLNSANTINTTESKLANAPTAAAGNESVHAFNNNFVTQDYTTREMRGTWIATVKNTNMKAGMNEVEFTAWAEETCQKLYDYGFNTVIFQVKPSADALYKSELAPWSSFITGKAQGTDPGYDPLAIMIRSAHKRGLELHAWVNPYRVTMPSDSLEGLAPNNIAKLHPDWVVKFGNQHYLNPGIPEVKQYLVSSVMEIVNNYDVDAIHIDDYFYPYPVSGQVYDDSAAFSAYGGGISDLGDWRRNNVTSLISDLYTSIKGSKQWVQLGVSPFGVWRNASMDATGSNTRAGHSCYDSLYADTRDWISKGIIDYITPQLYWSTEYEIANYKVLAQWWANEVETYAKVRPVNLYIGMGDYKAGDNADPKWHDPSEISTQIMINRENSTIKGQMHYSINSVMANKINYLDNVKDTLYQPKSIPPAQQWIQGAAPNEPEAVITKNGATVNIAMKDSSLAARKFIIYRYEGYEVPAYQSKNIICTVYSDAAGNASFVDTSIEANKVYTYAVKAVSKTGVASNSAAKATIQ